MHLTGLAPPQEVTEPDSLGSWLWQIAQEPGVMEILVLLPVLVVGSVILLHAMSIAGEVRRRAALTDYLLGVEQALAGDLPGARRRLERVLSQDPENHHARLLYGLVLAKLGDAAEAHKQHLYLHRAFQVQSSDNDLALARSLLAVGRPADAAAAAERALGPDSAHTPALRVLFRAQLAAGLPGDAGRTGETLAKLLPVGEQEEVRRRAASALALAGAVHLRSGSRNGAEEFCNRAMALASDLPEVRRLHSGLEVARVGSAQLLRQLTSGPSHDETELPVPASHALVQVREPGSNASPDVRALTSLLPISRRRCGACQGDVQGAQAVCPHCGSEGRVQTLEPALFHDLESATRLMDDIDETRAHVARLIQAALEGNEESREDLLEMGGNAVEQLLAVAIKRGAEDDVAVSILRAMGPAITPSLFRAYEQGAEGPRRALSAFLGHRSPAGVVGRIVQGFGAEALPHFEELLDTDNRDLRKITIDFFIGLADSQEFQRILDRFPPMEVLHRLNKAERSALIRFLSKVEPDSFLAAGLLPDSAFYRDVELFEAIASADHPDELKRILQDRGSNRSLVVLLIRSLGDGALAGAATEILQHFGSQALDHMLAAFTDPDCPEALREALQSQISRIGAGAVEKICACFGPRSSPLDTDLERLLLDIGEVGIVQLESTYEHGGLLAYLGALGKRHSNRRERIIRALGGIGVPAGYRVLQGLRQREKDADLKLRLSQAIHELDRRGVSPQPREGHGQAG
jgi:tetratricopeptide (TPR) repeat protein